MGRLVPAQELVADVAPAAISVAGAFARHHAVVIGVDVFVDQGLRLQTAVADARAVADLLARDQGFDVLRQMYDEEATLAAVRAVFERDLPARVGPEDRVVVYVASHGKLVLGEGGPAGHLVVHDSVRGAVETYWPMAALHDALSALPCRHLLLVLDCCFAGAFRWAAQRDLTAVTLYEEQLDRCLVHPAWQVITSAASDETALDLDPGNRENVGGHSPFARAFLSGVGEGKADVVEDGIILASELYLHLRTELGRLRPSVGHEQTAGLFTFAKHGKGEFAFQRPGFVISLPPAPRLTLAENPYRGLQVFDVADRDLFFGRARVVDALAARVHAERFVVVLGPSGVGKSSLVRAGLIPALRATGDEVPPPARLGDAPEEVLSRLLAASSGSGRRVLVIDQLEELITQCADAARREGFLSALAAVLADEARPVCVVATLRSDYEPSFVRGRLAPFWRRARFVVPPMTQDELREAIEKPALSRVLYFEPPALVDQLINEVVLMPGALPLLSFALSELYRAYLARGAEERSLREEDYLALGGVTSSITRRATAELDRLVAEDPAYAATVERVMIRFVSVEGGEPVRRRVAEGELVHRDEAESRRAAEVVRRFSEARLLVSDAAGEGGDAPGAAVLEPAHDALIAGWDRMREWLTRRRAALPLLAELREEARRWRDEGRAVHRLWASDPRLPQLVAMGRAEPHVLNADEQSFVDESLLVRRRRRRNLVAGVVAAFAVLSSLLVVVWLLQRRAVANEQRALDEARSRDLERRRALAQAALVLSTRPGAYPAALVEAMAAWAGSEDAGGDRRRIADALREVAGRGVISRPLTGHAAAVVDATLSEDGRWIATLGADGDGRVWDASGRLVTSIAAPSAKALRFSPDAKLLVTAGPTSAVWRVPSGERAFSFAGDDEAQRALALFSKDGRRLFTLDGLHRLEVRDAGSGALLASPEKDEPPAKTPHPPILDLALSPDGRLLLATDDEGTIRVHDAGTNEILRRLHGHADSVNGLAFSADGKSLLSAGDSSVRLWDLEKGKQIRSTPQNGAARTVAFLPHDLAITGDDYALRVFETNTWAMERELRPTGRMDLSPGGAVLAVASPDGVARLWEPASGRLRLLLDDGGGIGLALFFPDGDHLLTTGAPGSDRTWDLRATGEVMLRLQRDDGGFRSNGFAVRLAADGRMLTCGRSAEVWRLAGLRAERVHALSGDCDTAAWVAGDTRILIHHRRGVRLLDAATAKVVADLDGAARPVVSPDGRTFTTTSRRSELRPGTNEWMETTTVRTWSAIDGSRISEVTTKPTGRVPAIEPRRSPDGTRTVALEDGGAMLLRDARSGDVLWTKPAPPGVKPSRGIDLEFSADGARILAVDDDAADLLDGRTLSSTCALRGRVLAWGERSTGGSHRIVVRAGDGVDVIDADTCGILAHVVHHGDADDWLNASLSPDGRLLALTSDAGDARVIDLDPAAAFAFGCRVLAAYAAVPGADEDEIRAVRARCAADPAHPPSTGSAP